MPSGTNATDSAPTRARPAGGPPTPPGPGTGHRPGLEAPGRAAPEAADTAGADSAVISAPSLVPPQLRGAGALSESALEAVTAVWRGDQFVDALWSADQVRNAWALIRGLGWRKIYNGRDGAFTALTALASQARQTGRPITFREEPDGMIHEIYLW